MSEQTSSFERLFDLGFSWHHHLFLSFCSHSSRPWPSQLRRSQLRPLQVVSFWRNHSGPTYEDVESDVTKAESEVTKASSFGSGRGLGVLAEAEGEVGLELWTSRASASWASLASTSWESWRFCWMAMKSVMPRMSRKARDHFVYDLGWSTELTIWNWKSEDVWR